MQIIVNGQPHELPDNANLADLLASLGLDPRRLAVERNKLIVRRAQYAATALADGDVLEIVTLVGGG